MPVFFVFTPRITQSYNEFYAVDFTLTPLLFIEPHPLYPLPLSKGKGKNPFRRGAEPLLNSPLF
jgi:hypothetical protein